MDSIEYQRSCGAPTHRGLPAGVQDLALRWVRREAARVRHPLAILDVGGGTGRLLQPFGTVAACGLQPGAVAADMDAYDVITCLDVLRYRPVDEAVTLLLDLQRALKRGGLLLVHVDAFDIWRDAHGEAVHSQRRYRRRELARLLQATGLTSEFISYRLPLALVPALMGRWPSRRRPPSAAGRAAEARSGATWLSWWHAHMIRLENRLLLAGWRTLRGTALFASARKREPTGTGPKPGVGPFLPPQRSALNLAVTAPVLWTE